MARGAAALPHNRVVDRLAGGPIPDQRRFALVGDADRGHVRRADALPIQHGAGHVALRAPDVVRVVLDPAGPRENLLEFLLLRTTGWPVSSNRIARELVVP